MEDTTQKNMILSLEAMGEKITVEMPWDADINDALNAFYGICVTATWQPNIILESMKEFSEDKLKVLKKNLK